MSYDKIKYLSVNSKTGKIMLTTAPNNVSPVQYEKWIYRPTHPTFEGKLILLTEDVLSGLLQPLNSCNHRKWFDMLVVARQALKLDAVYKDSRYHLDNFKVFEKYVGREITIPYFLNKEIDLPHILEFIEGPLSSQFEDSYKDAKRLAELNGYVFISAVSRVRCLPSLLLLKDYDGEYYVTLEKYYDQGIFYPDKSECYPLGKDLAQAYEIMKAETGKELLSSFPAICSLVA